MIAPRTKARNAPTFALVQAFEGTHFLSTRVA